MHKLFKCGLMALGLSTQVFGASDGRSSEDHTLTVDMQSGKPQLSLDFPKLPTRNQLDPEMNLSYVGDSQGLAEGFVGGWRYSESSITIIPESGIPSHNYMDRIDFDDTGDTRFQVSLDGERLSYLESNVEAQTIHYTLEKHREKIRVIRYDSPFTIKIRLHNGNLKPIEIPSGFEVIRPDGRRSIYSGDLSVAEGIPVTNSNPELGPVAETFVSRWPLTYEILPGGETIEYIYQKHEGRSILSEISFAGGLSKYYLNWIPVDHQPRTYEMGYPQSYSYLYTRLTACFHNEPLQTWVFEYDDQPVSLEAASCMPSRHSQDPGLPSSVDEALDFIEAKALDLADWARESWNALMNEAAEPTMSRLTRISRYGRKVDSKATPDERQPTLNFTYTGAEVAGRESLVRDYPIRNQISGIGSEGNTGFLDVNYDGWLDIVQFDGLKNNVYLRKRSQEGSEILDEKSFVLHREEISGTVREVTPLLNESEGRDTIYTQGDFNGDGWGDLTEVQDNGEWRIFVHDPKSHRFLSRYDSVKLLRAGQQLPFSLSSSLLKDGAGTILDVNADGRSDILIPASGSDNLVWQVYLNRTREGSRTITFEEHQFAFPFKTTELTLLKSAAYRFQDMNGDGLPDFIRFTGEEFGETMACVYENMGRSSFSNNQEALFRPSSTAPCDIDQRVILKSSPDASFQADRSRLASIWILDINRDGRPDIVDMSHDKCSVVAWLQLDRSLAFQAPQTLSLGLSNCKQDALTVDLDTKSNTTILDIDHDGADEILVYQNNSQQTRIRILDFNGTGSNAALPAGLLQSIDQEDGSFQRLYYANAQEEIDQQIKRRKNIVGLRLPFTDFVVKHVLSRLGSIKTTTPFEETNLETFEYAEPYWDYNEGTFLGYRLAWQREPGAFHQEHGATEDGTLTETISAIDPKDPRYHGILAGELAQESLWTLPWSDKDEASFQTTMELLQAYDENIPVPTSDGPMTPEDARLARVKTYNYQVWPKGSETLSDLQGHSRAHAFFNTIDQTIKECSETSRTCVKARVSSVKMEFDEEEERLTQYQDIEEAIHIVRGDNVFDLPRKILTTTYAYDEASEKLSIHDNISVEETKQQDGYIVGRIQSTYDATFGKVATRSISIQDNFDTSEISEKLAALLPDSGVERFRKLNYAYHPGHGNIKSLSDDLGRLASYEYDESGIFLLKETNARQESRLACFGPDFCEKGLKLPASSGLIPQPSYRDPIYIQGPGGEWSLKDYDELGRLRKTIDDELFEREYHYTRGHKEAWGTLEIISREPQALNVSREIFAWDARGQRRLRARQLKDETVRLDEVKLFNRRGSVFFQASPSMAALSWPQLKTNPAMAISGHVGVGITSHFNGAGQTTARNLPNGASISLQYFDWGVQRSIEKGADNTTKSLLSKDGLSIEAVLDEKGKAHRFWRDDLGLVRNLQLDGDEAGTTYGYDSLGQLTYVKIPGILERIIVRDKRGHPLRLMTLSSGSSPKLLTLEYSYDELSRLTFVTEIEGDTSKLVETYTYDSKTPSRLLSSWKAGDPYDTRTEYSYDKAGRLLNFQKIYTGIDTDTPEKTFSESYEYSPRGLLAKRTTPNSVIVRYTYDSLDQIVSITAQLPQAENPVTVYQLNTYADNGQPGTISYGANVHAYRTYTNQNEVNLYAICVGPVSAAPCLDNAVYLEQLAYDARGNIVKRDIPKFGVLSYDQSFTWNERGEMTKATDSIGSLAWDYKGSGEFSVNEQLGPTLDPNASVMFQPKGTAKMPTVFDDFGRLKSFSHAKAIEYNGLNQMTAFTTEKASFKLGYDSSGQRSYKTQLQGNASTTLFTPEPFSSSGETEAYTSLPLPGAVTLQINHRSGKMFYVMSDAWGNPTLTLNEAGSIQKRRTATPYGMQRAEQILDSAEAQAPLGFRNWRTDPETGWLTVGSRVYIPELAAFSSMDLSRIMDAESCAGSSWKSCLPYGFQLF